jgi:hypothetical protein
VRNSPQPYISKIMLHSIFYRNRLIQSLIHCADDASVVNESHCTAFINLRFRLTHYSVGTSKSCSRSLSRAPLTLDSTVNYHTSRVVCYPCLSPEKLINIVHNFPCLFMEVLASTSSNITTPKTGILKQVSLIALLRLLISERQHIQIVCKQKKSSSRLTLVGSETDRAAQLSFTRLCLLSLCNTQWKNSVAYQELRRFNYVLTVHLSE